MFSLIYLAAYLVAFLCDKRSLPLLLVCIACEFVGWSVLFSWSNNFHYGMLTHTTWGNGTTTINNERGLLELQR